MPHPMQTLLVTELEITEGIKASPLTIILRCISFLLVGSWIAIYPVYLLVIYMQIEKFFSYDIFTDGILGIKSFILMVVILIIMSSLALWGFIIFLANYFKTKKKPLLIMSIIFALFSVAAHIALFALSSPSNYPRLIWLSALGLIFMVSAALFFLDPVKNLITNWWGPMIAVALTAILPIFTTEIVADIVRTGLESFKVGGNVNAQIYAAKDNHLITEGKLLLLTPNYAYLRSDKNGHIAIARSDQNYVHVK